MMYDMTHSNFRYPHSPNEGHSDDFTSSHMQCFLSHSEILIADSFVCVDDYA